jgi:hypothetical protein
LSLNVLPPRPESYANWEEWAKALIASGLQDAGSGVENPSLSGLPLGGDKHAFLQKISDSDYDTQWVHEILPRVNVLDYMTPANGYTGAYVQPTGIAGVGTDMKPACVKALQDCNLRYGGRGQVWFPPGAWRFASGILESDMKSNRIVGGDSNGTVLFYEGTSTPMFHWSGLGGYSGGGVEGVTLWLTAGGTTGLATAIFLSGDFQFQPSAMFFRDVNITKGPGHYWYNGILANGQTRNTGAQGIRVGLMEMIKVFGCRNLGIYINNFEQLTILNAGTYSPLGGTGGADIYFTGGANNGNVNANVTVAQLSPVFINDIPMVDGWPVFFQSTGTMPGGLNGFQTYYAIGSTSSNNGYNLSLTPGGAPIAVTSFGTGTLIATRLLTEHSNYMFAAGFVCNGTLHLGNSDSCNWHGTAANLSWEPGLSSSKYGINCIGTITGTPPATVLGDVS